MKKMLHSLSMAVLMTILGGTISIGTASAKDIWVDSASGQNTYVMTESIRGKIDNFNGKPTQVWVNLKHVDQDQRVFMSIAMFNIEYKTWSCEFPNGMRGLGRISDSPYGSAIWKAVQPYLPPKFRK